MFRCHVDSRFGYVAVPADPTSDAFKVAGSAKVDLLTGEVVATHTFGDNVFGGELVFVSNRFDLLCMCQLWALPSRQRRVVKCTAWE